MPESALEVFLRLTTVTHNVKMRLTAVEHIGGSL